MRRRNCVPLISSLKTAHVSVFKVAMSGTSESLTPRMKSYNRHLDFGGALEEYSHFQGSYAFLFNVQRISSFESGYVLPDRPQKSSCRL